MESAIDSAVSKVALETFEAEAREAIAAFVVVLLCCLPVLV